MKLRDYQIELAEKGSKIISEHGFLYMAVAVRLGKSITSMAIAESVGAKNVLFVTKKKALSSVQSDYLAFMPPFQMEILNWGSEHKALGTYDFIILDEQHSVGAFPKPSNRHKKIKEVYLRNGSPKIILMSGTPTPESYSQIYHQVCFIKGNPFENYGNFYKFAKDYVTVRQFKVQGMFRNDYSNCDFRAIEEMKPFTIEYTQAEAGFVNQINEQVLNVKMSDRIYDLVRKLKRDKVIELPEGVILGDQGAKLMSKIHQLCSGTIKYESGESEVLDYTKAEFIKERFVGMKIAIFYKFVEEYNAIKKILGDSVTNDLPVFKSTDKSIALQIVSGREGINLSEAEALVYYNIDFSATSYWQSRDRLTTIDRTSTDVYWIFAEKGIEKDVYNTVIKKKDYTLRHFRKNEEPE